MALAQQGAILGFSPNGEKVREHQAVRVGRKRVAEAFAWNRVEACLQSVRGNILARDFADGWRVEHARSQIGPAFCQSDDVGSVTAAHVDEMFDPSQVDEAGHVGVRLNRQFLHRILEDRLYLGVVRFLLLPIFDVTHALVDDWYNHAVSLPAFLFGFLLVKDGRVIEHFVRLRWTALTLFLTTYIAFAVYAWTYRADDVMPPEALRSVMRFVYAADQWSAIVAALGFGALHLTRDSPMLRTLTLAVFPFYIAHQTIIVVTGHHLKALHLPVALESALLISITAAGCWLTFDIARRFDLLRPLFGLGPREKKTVAPLDPAPLAQ